MTEIEIKKKNPWLEIADKLDCLYSDTAEYVYSKDVDMVRTFNKRVVKNKANNQVYHPDELILNIPPEPWQGNPLKAKVIFLSLNPGFVENVNWKLAKVLQNDKGILKRMLDFKKKTLRLEAESFFPESNDEKPIGCKDSISMLGDWYWEKGLAKLRENVVDKDYTEKQFYRDIALMQYHSYTSEKYGRTFTKTGYFLESQKFTVELIKYIIDKNKDTIFVIMRSFNKWKELLEDGEKDFWKKNQKRFLIKNNGSMSQAISENNLKLKDGTMFFDELCNKLRE